MHDVRAQRLLVRSLQAGDALGVRRALARGADAAARLDDGAPLWWLALQKDDEELELSKLLLAARGGGARSVPDVLLAMDCARLSTGKVHFVLQSAHITLEDIPALMRRAVEANRAHAFEAVLIARGGAVRGAEAAAADGELLPANGPAVCGTHRDWRDLAAAALAEHAAANAVAAATLALHDPALEREFEQGDPTEPEFEAL
ncbi:hypothetical protein T492DRAFT_875874 [Pavlovales sp. CCMP2436]|nr:hypothetical protein T492DRAFT_875874 [Pavlovales sp. CCMP2436]